MSAFRAGIALIAVLAVSLRALAGDPDITADFIAPPGVIPDSEFFTFRGIDPVARQIHEVPFKVSNIRLAEFPALAGQSVSLTVLRFAASAGAINPPHLHPRSAELLIMTEGALNVGFVDSTNKHFNQTLYVGDTFVFPKGLVHFQVNDNPSNRATAISAFGSSDPGTISLPKTIFGSHMLALNAKALQIILAGFSSRDMQR